jgi:hypothetical protein
MRIASPHCGELWLGDFEVVGEGSFVLDLYADGERLLPKIAAEGEGAVLRGLQARGELALEGRWPLTVWSLGEGVGDSALRGGEGASYGAGLIGRGDGASVLVGAHSAEVSTLRIAFTEQIVELGWSLPDRALAPGEAVYLDPLFAALGPEPRALWDAWADKVAPDWLPAQPPSGGWSVPEAASEEELLVGAPGAGVVRIEGRDPSDLAEQIEALGAVPGLVWAPLLVSRDSTLYEGHPDWWARDSAGQELDWDGQAVLDPSQEAALRWLEFEMGARTEEGWRYQRLDGLGAGTLLGPVSLRLILQTLREASPGVWLVGGADTPLLPSVGWLDGWALPEGEPSWELVAALSFARGRLGWLEAAPSLSAGPAEEALALLAGGGIWQQQAPSSWSLLLPADLVQSGEELWPGDPLVFQIPAVPVQWESADWTVLSNLGSAPVTVEGPGGDELLSGEHAPPGARTLSPGRVEVWHRASR